MILSHCSASWISSASDSWSQSSSSWISFRHEQGFTPFPFNQCWNMALHRALSVECAFSMLSSSVPVSSKSKRTPKSFHSGANVLMIWIFLLPARNIDKLAKDGAASVIILILRKCMMYACHQLLCMKWNSMDLLTKFWNARGTGGGILMSLVTRARYSHRSSICTQYNVM